MPHFFRTITLVVCLGLLPSSPIAWDIGPHTDEQKSSADRLALAPPLGSGPRATPPARINADAWTVEAQELVDEAHLLFDDAGFTLPAVTIEFPAEPDACFDNGGVYIPKLRTVRMCRPSLKTMVHELAHSWVETTLTAAERDAFLDLRDLETWAGGEHWGERGAEQAAEVITWAVMDADISVHWIYTNPDGTTFDSTRLLRVPNSEHAVLVSAYQQLTGALPDKRIADGPPTPRAEVESPEARRAA